MTSSQQTRISDPKIDALSDLMTSLTSDELIVEPLDRVQLLRMIAATAEAAIPDAVTEARATGATWDQLGQMLGVSRQSAHERYA